MLEFSCIERISRAALFLHLSLTLNLVAAGVPFPFYFYHGDLYSVLWKSDQNFRPISTFTKTTPSFSDFFP